MARKSLSKKVRFEVFKRDSFTCQYCGRMAPDVVLEVDHVNPVANGGTNDIMNLVTSCFDCNRGKGKKTLTDRQEIQKQQDQLKELNEKREQLSMMVDWRNELLKFKSNQVDEFEKQFRVMTGDDFTELGRKKASKWIDEFGMSEILECLDISSNQYLDDGSEKIFNYIPRIANVRKRQMNNPLIGEHNYIKAILRNRGIYFNDSRMKRIFEEICDEKLTCDEVKEIAITARNWTDFIGCINELYEGDF